MSPEDKEDIIKKINTSGNSAGQDGVDDFGDTIDGEESNQNDGEEISDENSTNDSSNDMKFESFDVIDKEDKPLFVDAKLGVTETVDLTLDELFKNILKEDFDYGDNSNIFVNKEDMEAPVETPVRPKISEPERKTKRKSKPFDIPVRPQTNPLPKANK